MRWIEHRCDTHKGLYPCRALLFKTSTGLDGLVEIKCQKCSQIKVIGHPVRYDSTVRR